MIRPVIPALAAGPEGQPHQRPGQPDRAQNAKRKGDQTMQAERSAPDRGPGETDGDRRDRGDADDRKQPRQKAARGQRWTHWPWALRYHWPVLMRGRSWVWNIRAAAVSVVAPSPAAWALRA